MDTQVLSQYLPEYMEAYLPKATKGFYVCPYCGSGEKRNRTGAMKHFHGNGKELFKCFSCNKSGDLFALIGQVEHLTFKESLERAQKLFSGYDPKPIQAKKARKTNVKNKYKDYIERCARNVNGAGQYLKERGFTSADARRFEIGYDQNTNGIVIPYGKTYSYYLWRSLTEKRFDKPRAEDAGPEPIYNVAALKSSIPCFICESPIDAMSVMVASDCNAIAIGGTGVKKLTDYIDTHEIKAPLIVSLDDDEGKERNAGLECAKTLMGELAGRRIPFVFAKYSKDLYPKTRRKDPNDMLVSRREIFESDLKMNSRAALIIKSLMEYEIF